MEKTFDFVPLIIVAFALVIFAAYYYGKYLANKNYKKLSDLHYDGKQHVSELPPPPNKVTIYTKDEEFFYTSQENLLVYEPKGENWKRIEVYEEGKYRKLLAIVTAEVHCIEGEHHWLYVQHLPERKDIV